MDECPLAAVERSMALPDALAAARGDLARREATDALEHAVALLHHVRPAAAPPAELDTLLAEAHARIADGCDLGTPAGAARHRRHRETGLACADAAVKVDPASGPARYWRGRLLLLAADGERSYGRLSPALAALEEADRLAPLCDEAGPARYVARIYQETPGWPMLGSTPKAVAWYERAVGLAPEGLQGRLWLGDAYAAARQPGKARAEWERVLAAPVRAGREKEEGGIRAEAKDRLEKLKAP